MFVDIFNTPNKYQIIYADPPWDYQFSGTRSIKIDDYSTMPIKSILALPIKNLADDKSFLFLWSTYPRLREALSCFEAWDFRYIGCGFCWVKRNENNMGWHWGMGGWTRQNAENCLLGIRGSPQRSSASVLSIIDTPIMRHSRKPDEIVRGRIIELCGNLRRIELFARRQVDGWDCWGNEVS